MEEVGENKTIKGVKIVGWIYSILGVISILSGLIATNLILNFFPIFRYVLIAPLKLFFQKYPIEFVSNNMALGSVGNVNLVSLLDIHGGIISLIGGIILLIIGISLLKNKKIYLFMMIFSFSAIVGISQILNNVLGYFDLVDFVVECIIIIVNIYVGYYFLKIRRMEAFKK